MKDIIYAGFSQLSYLNWHNLGNDIFEKMDLKDRKLETVINNKEIFDQIKTSAYDEWEKSDGAYYARVEEGKKIYSMRDLRIFMLYSEDYDKPDENPKFTEFSEWEFLTAYNHKMIRKEAGSIIDIEDSGFQASAFKKGNRVMIAYRGTDEKIDWIRTNLLLGMNRYADQLTCVAWFYEKVTSLVKDAAIYITGHSLGGCLAQFAHIYSGCKHDTKTWNGLGVGEAHKIFEIDSSKTLSMAILKDVLLEKGYLKDEEWQKKCANPNGKEIRIGYVEENSENRYDDGTDSFENITNILEDEMNDFEIEIAYKLKLLYKFQKNYKSGRNSRKLENIYLTKDLTPNLQKRFGLVNRADEEFLAETEDGGSSSIFRKVVSIFTKSFGEYHSTPNFLPFINDSGDIEEGKLSKIYTTNAIKTIILNSDEMKEEAIKILSKDRRFPSYPMIKKDNFLVDGREGEENNSKEVVELKDLTDEFLFDFLLEKKLENSSIRWCFKEQRDYYVGKFVNYDMIGGVVGGIPIKILENSSELIKKIEGKIDIPSLKFFKEYDSRYGLIADNVPPYYYARDILEIDKNKKIYLGDLAYKLFVKERSRIGSIRDSKELEASKKVFNQSKEVFEEISKEYQKESYELENSYVWGKIGNQNRLRLNLVGDYEMPNLMEYINSYKRSSEEILRSEKRMKEYEKEKLRKQREDMEERGKIEAEEYRMKRITKYGKETIKYKSLRSEF